jgi:hypothetical protein
MMVGSSATNLVGLVVQGRAETDLGPMDVTLRIPTTTRVAGRGPLDLHVVAADWELAGVDLHWVVSTNKGWFHLRGTARLSGHAHDQPLRMDVYGGLATPPDPDRVALRLYPPDSDPNLAGPIVKLMGVFEGPAVARIADASLAAPEADDD